jgi:TetR/AcrR family acrAB operon transcriptional repressor
MSTGVRRIAEGRMARRTKTEAEATRERILDAAERIFRDKGVAHASLELVARAARVTRGAIYWHFKDKGELFEAMMQRVALPAQAMMERAGEAGATDPLQRLRMSACEVLLRAARDAQVKRIFEISFHRCEYVGDAASIRDRQVANHAECLGTIESAIRECVKEGLLPKGVEPRLAAIGAMAYVSGILYHWVLDPASFSLEKDAESLVDTYFRGLVAAPAEKKPGRPKAARASLRPSKRSPISRSAP